MAIRDGHAETQRPHPRYIRRLLHQIKEYENGCWIWTGACMERNGFRYGRMRIADRKPVYVHRLSYLIFKGEIPAGKTIHHTCGQTLCINPDHLEIASRKWNTAQGNRDRKNEDVPF